MTTPPQTLSDTAAASPPLAAAFSPAGLSQRLRDFAAFFRAEKHWFLVGAIYLFAWYTPAVWAWGQWSDSFNTLCFQPFVPVGTALLIWGRRDLFASQWRRLKSEEGRSGRRQRKGNAIPLALGCLLLLGANIVQVKGAANVALVIIAVGVLYQVYGPVMLRVLAIPLLFFSLIIMPPDSVTDKLTGLFLAASLKVAASVLNLLHRGASGQYYLLGVSSLHLPATTIDFFLCGSRGLPSAVPVAVSLACWMLYKRVRFNYGLMMVIGGFVLALVVNIVRIIVVAELTPTNPALAETIKNANNWFFNIPLIFLTLYAARGMEWLMKRSPAPVRNAINGLGSIVNLIVYPLVWLLYQLGSVGKLQKRSERGLERMLKNISPKKKRKY